MNEQKQHSLFSASGASRWLACPASIPLSKDAPPQPSSPYAQEGTEAHEILEELIKSWLNKKEFKIDTTLEKYAHALFAFQLIRDDYLSSSVFAELLCETKVKFPLSDLSVGDQYGTVDAAIYDPEAGKITVYDFKYGKGVAVSPYNNPQLIYYALGVLDFFKDRAKSDIHEIELVIIQPRAGGDPVKRHAMTEHELSEWFVKFSFAIIEALKPNASEMTNPGSHCRWCPAKDTCPAQRSNAVVKAQAEFEPILNHLTIKKPSDITVSEFPEYLNRIDLLSEWMDAVKEHAHRFLEGGGKIDGWKLEPKRATRKWADMTLAEFEAKHEYGDIAFSKPELLSPAQFEKTVKDKNFLAKHTIAISSGTNLVRNFDSVIARNEFDNVVELKTKTKGN